MTYMPVFGNMAISCYHDSPFPDPIRLVCSNATQIFFKVNFKKKLNVCAELSAKPPQNLNLVKLYIVTRIPYIFQKH